MGSTIVNAVHAALAVALALMAALAAAQGYPAKPVRFVVPYPPGGNTDVLARLIGQRLAESWGQQVIMDNRGGAAGTVGADLAAKAPPDGYTIVMGTFGNMLVANSLYKKLAYEPLRDFAPVVLVANPPGLLVVHPSLPVKDVRQLIALAKANPGKLNYASSGSGAWNHLFGELFKSMAKVNITHVPYRGGAPAVTDLLGGHVEVMFAPFPPALPQIKARKLRVLAVTTGKRSGLLPEVPTITENGLPGYEAEGWFAVLAPAKTPQPIVAQLNKEINRILQLPDVKAALAADGAEPAGGTPEQLAQSIRKNQEKWDRIIRALNIRLD
ncbi:MAG: tripartite tricarboxylate transporter substrate binding protein [Betaproteobacteria bacterium]|nr:tripartite tricarboxylate transporter substrate binding protein [Betaproteobacteria bacterium]